MHPAGSVLSEEMTGKQNPAVPVWKYNSKLGYIHISSLVSKGNKQRKTHVGEKLGFSVV